MFCVFDSVDHLGLNDYNSMTVCFDNFKNDTIQKLFTAKKKSKKKLNYQLALSEAILSRNIFDDSSIPIYDSVLTETLSNADIKSEENITMEMKFGLTNSKILNTSESESVMPFIYLKTDNYGIKGVIRISLMDKDENVTEGCYVDIDTASHKSDTYYCYDYLPVEDVPKYIRNTDEFSLVITILKLEFQKKGKQSKKTKKKTKSVTLVDCLIQELKCYSNYIKDLEDSKSESKMSFQETNELLENILNPSLVCHKESDEESDGESDDESDQESDDEVELSIVEKSKQKIQNMFSDKDFSSYLENTIKYYLQKNKDEQLKVVMDVIKNCDWESVNQDQLNKIKNIGLGNLQNSINGLELMKTILDDLYKEKYIDDTILCNMCCEEKINTVFIPCGHMFCCDKCSDKACIEVNYEHDGHYDTKQCPLCKVSVTNIQKVFMI